MLMLLHHILNAKSSNRYMKTLSKLCFLSVKVKKNTKTLKLNEICVF